MISYIIRLDDIHDRMNHNRFNILCELLNKYNIKPILGVIPNNLDESLNIDKKDDFFWSKIKKLQNNNNYIISLHGYEHKYTNQNSGVMNINNYSEFSGLSYEEQNNKIVKALGIFKKYGIKTNMFMAPAHSFDKITIKVLYQNGIINITDGFYLYPYFKDNIWYIPQQFWAFRDIKFSGVFTFCFHIDTFTDKEFNKFILNGKEFLEKNNNKFVNILELDLSIYNSIKYKVLNNMFNFLYKIIYKAKHKK